MYELIESFEDVSWTLQLVVPVMATTPDSALYAVVSDAGENVRLLQLVAAVYGPIRGPPPGTPVGTAETLLVSATSRCMFTRPLPVCCAVPAGSASCANRPTMTALLAAGSAARSNAATPATIADDAEVPLMVM